MTDAQIGNITYKQVKKMYTKHTSWAGFTGKQQKKTKQDLEQIIQAAKKHQETIYNKRREKGLTNDYFIISDQTENVEYMIDDRLLTVIDVCESVNLSCLLDSMNDKCFKILNHIDSSTSPTRLSSEDFVGAIARTCTRQGLRLDSTKIPKNIPKTWKEILKDVVTDQPNQGANRNLGRDQSLLNQQNSLSQLVQVNNQKFDLLVHTLQSMIPNSLSNQPTSVSLQSRPVQSLSSSAVSHTLPLRVSAAIPPANPDPTPTTHLDLNRIVESIGDDDTPLVVKTEDASCGFGSSQESDNLTLEGICNEFNLPIPVVNAIFEKMKNDDILTDEQCLKKINDTLKNYKEHMSDRDIELAYSNQSKNLQTCKVHLDTIFSEYQLHVVVSDCVSQPQNLPYLYVLGNQLLKKTAWLHSRPQDIFPYLMVIPLVRRVKNKGVFTTEYIFATTWLLKSDGKACFILENLSTTGKTSDLNWLVDAFMHYCSLRGYSFGGLSNKDSVKVYGKKVGNMSDQFAPSTANFGKSYFEVILKKIIERYTHRKLYTFSRVKQKYWNDDILTRRHYLIALAMQKIPESLSSHMITSIMDSEFLLKSSHIPSKLINSFTELTN